MKHNKRKYKNIFLIMAIAGMLLLAGCSLGQTATETPQTEEEQGNTGFLLTGPGSFDSADTAVVVSINTDEKTITFLNLVVHKNYTLEYDGTTVFSDKYGETMSLEQLKPGDIVDVTFLKSKKKLATLALSASAWSNEAVSRYTIDATTHNVTIGNDVYKLADDVKIFSDGQELEMIDLNSVDVLNFQGIGSTVHSIEVEKGHGYLRLSGDENFQGGWIEVGQNIIQKITEDMLLVVPEGNYQVNISITGGGGTKNVVINRNEEVTLDISDLEIEEVQYGQVVFAMSPSTAKLYIDGELVDTELPVTLEYGIHQMIAKADGYETVTRYLKVAEESAGIDITLELEGADEEDEEDDGDNSVSSGDALTVGYYQVYIDAPTGAEVYVDGNYVGIAPVSFKKEEGSHVITLRQSGYETRSYTIVVDDEEKNVTFSFADLVPSTSDLITDIIY